MVVSKLKSEKKMDKIKQEIQLKGLTKISEYFDLDATNLDLFEPSVLKHLNAMARLGLQFEKEMNLAKRSSEMNYIRLSKLVHENQGEMRKYIKKSLPHYFK